jgi:hypothetical protein
LWEKREAQEDFDELVFLELFGNFCEGFLARVFLDSVKIVGVKVCFEVGERESELFGLKVRKMDKEGL